MSTIVSLMRKKSIKKEVKNMKKLITILIVIAMVLSVNSTAFAAFTSILKTPYRATVTPGGTAGPTVTFSCALKNLTDNVVATQIQWSSVTAGSTTWLKANQYVETRGFGTWETWGVQAYTDNMVSTASPRYTGTGNPAGLVRSDVGYTIYSLPMCWRTKVGYWIEDPVHPGNYNYGTYSAPGSTAAIAHELAIYQGVSGGYTILYDGVTPHDLDPANPDDTTKIHAPGASSPYFPWFFMLDKNTDSDPVTTGTQTYFTDGSYYDATFIGSRGYHHAPGNVAVNFATPSSPGDKYYVYLGANFTLATPNKTYTTNKLTVESYHL